jgi:hypothetical protein
MADVRRDPSGGRGRPPDGAIVLGWLARVSLVLLVGGLVLVDAVSYGVTRLTLTDDAASAAAAASRQFAETHDPASSYAAAVTAALEEHGDSSVPADGFHIDVDGSVTVHVVRTAHTLVARYIPIAQDWMVVRAGSTRRPVS